MTFKNILMCVLLLCLCLASCEKSEKETQKVEDTKVVLENNKEKDYSALYSSKTQPNNLDLPLVVHQDLLLPLEEYSWEREVAPEMVVIHFTSNVVADRENPHNIKAVKEIFEQSGVSINYIIDRDGKVFCFIPEERAAWHAGKGEFLNIEKYQRRCNLHV